ncbi:MAG TPA: phenylalanine--tRNA ligase subunit beta [Candidatus Paceibacterota bacterium]
MKISYNWLNSFFDNALPKPEILAGEIIAHAFEVEGIEIVDGDKIIDIDVLANRGHDALSHAGIAREVGVILDMEPKIPKPKPQLSTGLNTSDHLVVRVETDLAPRVTKRLVTDIKVGESPKWLKDKLAVFGQRSINNVVDVTNYVLLEMGQPVHAFDYDKLAGTGKKKMTLRLAKSGEKLTLLDGKELTLDDKTLVWADDEKPLDLAGIKGGADSGVDEKTTRIVLSVCNFDPVYIRKARQRHKIITDASRSFEHALSPELAMLGNDRAVELIHELAGGSLAEAIDHYPQPQVLAQARFKTSDVNRLIGTKLSDQDIEALLDRFKHARFNWQKVGDEYVVDVPPERLDVRSLHEIVEEVARMYGYGKVKSSLPPTGDFIPKVHKNFYYNSLLKKLLVDLGYSELYNYVMRNKGEIELANSLVEGMEFLRTNMIDSLADNLAFNIKNVDLLGLQQVKIFELNKVFTLSEEHWALGIGIKNARGWKGKSERETLEETIESLTQSLQSLRTSDSRKWNIVERAEGVIVEVNIEELVLNLPVPASYGDVLSTTSNTTYKQVSQYPFVLRDIAVWTQAGTTAEEVHSNILANVGMLCVRVTLFDSFEKGDKTSYAFRLVFQAMDRTLTDIEVNEAMFKLTTTLTDLGYQIR